MTPADYANPIERHDVSWRHRLTTDDWVALYAALILIAFLGIVLLGYLNPDPMPVSCYSASPARR